MHQFELQRQETIGELQTEAYLYKHVTGAELLSLVNERVDRQAEVSRLKAVDSFYEQAYRMIDSPKARSAFDLSQEKPATRDAYGGGAAGMRMLLARRLVEAGVRFVSLEYGTWDNHFNIAPSLQGQVPSFDQALAALVTDLDDRGLLKTTLVTVTTEFGRTPRINSGAGRDHWSRVFSVLLAGAGIRRADRQVYRRQEHRERDHRESQVAVGQDGRGRHG